MSIHTSGDYEDRGRALLLEDRAAEALAVFEEGARRFPGDEDLELGRGLALTRLGEHSQAIGLLEELKARRPQSADILQALVEACLGRGLWERAAQAAIQAARSPEADARSIQRLARAFYEKGRRGDALALYQRATELDPEWSEAWFGHGACLWTLRRGEEALFSLRRACALAPEDWQARQFLGCSLFDLGRKEEARLTLQGVPLDAPWQRAALERLVACAWWPEDRERGKALERLWRETAPAPAAGGAS